MEQITLRLPTDVLESAEEAAESADLSRSEYLRNAVTSYVEGDVNTEASAIEAELEAAQAEVEAIRAEQDALTERALRLEVERDLLEEEDDRRPGVLGRARIWMFGESE